MKSEALSVLLQYQDFRKEYPVLLKKTYARFQFNYIVSMWDAHVHIIYDFTYLHRGLCWIMHPVFLFTFQKGTLKC